MHRQNNKDSTTEEIRRTNNKITITNTMKTTTEKINITTGHHIKKRVTIKAGEINPSPTKKREINHLKSILKKILRYKIQNPIKI